MDDSEDGPEERLRAYLETIERNEILFKESDEDVAILNELVVEMIKVILSVVNDSNSDCYAEKFFHVGSMTEGTRVGRPDEFDFMVILGKVSSMRIDEVICEERGTFITLNDETGAKPKRYFRNNKQGNRKTRCKEFNPLYHYVKDPEIKIKHLPKERIDNFYDAVTKTIEIITQHGRKCCTAGPSDERLFVKSVDEELHGPAITVLLQLKKPNSDPHKISVDLVPTWEIENGETLIEHLSFNIAHKHFYDRLKRMGRLHIIPCKYKMKKDETYSLSFAMTESFLMAGQSDTHKKCYKLLKYIFQSNAFMFYKLFSSFALKNIILLHSRSCKEEELCGCLIDILLGLQYKMDNTWINRPLVVPHIFNEKYNILQFDRNLVVNSALSTNKNILSRTIRNFTNIRQGKPPEPELCKRYLPTWLLFVYVTYILLTLPSILELFLPKLFYQVNIDQDGTLCYMIVLLSMIFSTVMTCYTFLLTLLENLRWVPIGSKSGMITLEVIVVHLIPLLILIIVNCARLYKGTNVLEQVITNYNNVYDKRFFDECFSVCLFIVNLISNISISKYFFAESIASPVFSDGMYCLVLSITCTVFAMFRDYFLRPLIP